MSDRAEVQEWWFGFTEANDRRCLWGLGRELRVRGRGVWDVIKENPAPFGWRYMRCCGRNAATLMPLWLYWPADVWRYRQNIVFENLIRLGFWDCPEGGLLWQEGRLTAPRWLRAFAWCFLNDADRAPV